MFTPVPNPSTNPVAAKFGEQDLIRRSASSIKPPAKRQTEVAKLIDVSKCIGCKACQVACLEWNNLTEEVGVNVGQGDDIRGCGGSTVRGGRNSPRSSTWGGTRCTRS